MRIHREGTAAILAFLLAAIAFTVGAVMLNGGIVVQTIAVLCWLLLCFSLFFFRYPERTIPTTVGAIVSPADGTVIEIFEVDEKEYFNDRVQKVGIFMSPADVHVNRSPIEGVVKFFRYQPGRFLRANTPDAATKNEQTIIGMENGSHKLLYKQIAGFVARRVCCDIREGHKVERGERIGIIKFGSRVDIFMPKSVEIRVQLKQKVTAGESIIGVFQDDQ